MDLVIDVLFYLHWSDNINKCSVVDASFFFFVCIGQSQSNLVHTATYCIRECSVLGYRNNINIITLRGGRTVAVVLGYEAIVTNVEYVTHKDQCYQCNSIRQSVSHSCAPS